MSILLSGVTLGLVHAQTQTPAPTQPQTQNADAPQPLAPVVVTGNLFDELASNKAVRVLTGDALAERRRSSLGETLASEVGVSSTYFGPIASRPTIRGLDGDRIRILSNGGASFDLSALSYDHASSLDPLAIERIEVLRGPAALQFGGSAMGGVVNVIDNRIPMRGSSTPLSLAAELGFESVSSGRSLSSLAEASDPRGNQLSWHVDGYARQSGQTRAPTARCFDETSGQLRASNYICNSQSESRGGALGVAWGSPTNRHGLSLSHTTARYGVVTEPTLSIDMSQTQVQWKSELALDGQARGPGQWQKLNVQATLADYMHDEIDHGHIGTRFRTRGVELRGEVTHRPIAGWRGAVGVQADVRDFQVAGEEAFSPPSKSQSTALFAIEEWRRGAVGVSIGARFESARVTALGEPSIERFSAVDQTRRFQPVSISAQGDVALSKSHSLSVGMSQIERTPRDYELFANGPHVATGAFEVGDARLKVERARAIEVAWIHRQAGWQSEVRAYQTRFNNYILLADTGKFRNSEGVVVASALAPSAALPEFVYSPVAARFRGVEVSAQSSIKLSGGTLTLSPRFDLVRANRWDTGEALPRIAPWKTGLDLAYKTDAWTFKTDVTYHAAQERVPVGTPSTEAYTLMGASASMRFAALGLSDARLMIVGTNLLNAHALPANSILTQTAPGRAPLPGRGVKIEMRLDL